MNVTMDRSQRIMRLTIFLALFGLDLVRLDLRRGGRGSIIDIMLILNDMVLISVRVFDNLDMNTLPLAFDSITAKNGSRIFLSMQHWLYQVGVWGLVHFWQLFIHPKFIIRHNRVLDGSFLALHWALFLGWFVPQIGLTSALLLHAAASAVEATLLFTNFALSHTTMPYLENSVREHWVERSLRRTVDIHSHSKKFGSILGPVMDMSVDWIMGYLNYQVVHHLWPLMPQHRQCDPRVHDAVQRLCAENPGKKLSYNVTTYDVAMWDMYANLARIARDFGEKKDLNAVHPQKPGNFEISNP